VAYLSALTLSFVLIPVAIQIRSEANGCSGWNRYIREYNAYGDPLNDRVDQVRYFYTLSDAQVGGIIDALNNDIESWRASDPPAAAEALNDQLIVVIEGWVDVFEALRDGTYSDQMLFDLQEEDDELERLGREADAACAS
jgi:hypothetical protein